MNYAIVMTKDFERDFKRLSKKYRSLDNDLELLTVELYANPTMGDRIDTKVRTSHAPACAKPPVRCRCFVYFTFAK